MLAKLRKGLSKQFLGMISTQINLPEGRKIDLAKSVPFWYSLMD